MKSTIPETGEPIGSSDDGTRPAEASLHGEILSRLRDYVVEGNIAGGARVPERQLCELFGISRTPLREALKVLADVSTFSGAKSFMRQALDAYGRIDVLVNNVGGTIWIKPYHLYSEDEVKLEIERLHYEMYGYYLRSDMHGYFLVNQHIHERIVAASGNETLRATYATFAGRIRRVRYTANFARKRARWAEAMREHEMILDALRRRAGSELADILFHHLRNKRTAAVEQMGDPTASSRSDSKPVVNS